MSTPEFDPGSPGTLPASRMVAVQGLTTSNDAIGIGRFVGQSGKRTSVVLKPRTADAQAAARWYDEICDISCGEGIRAPIEQELPTPQSLRGLFSELGEDQFQKKVTAAKLDWLRSNTQLFYLIKNSIDLAGVFQEQDRDMINERFTPQDGSDPLRDGRGLLDWVRSHADTSGFDAQQGLIKRLQQFKLQPGSDLNKLEVHMTSLYSTWKKIDGNTSDRLGNMWMIMLNSLPSEPQGSHLTLVRAKLAELMSSSSGLLGSPPELIQSVVRHASNLGLPRKPISSSGAEAVLALGAEQKEQKVNDCASCDIFVCVSRTQGGKKNCYAFNKNLSLSGLSANQRRAIKMCQTYVDITQCTSIKGKSFKEMRTKVKESTGDDKDGSANKEEKKGTGGHMNAPLIENARMTIGDGMDDTGFEDWTESSRHPLHFKGDGCRRECDAAAREDERERERERERPRRRPRSVAR